MPAIEWRLRAIIARQHLSLPEVLQKLRASGVKLSRSQLYRLTAQPPSRIAFSLLAGLCDALRCSPTDLLMFKRGDSASRETPSPDLPPEFQVPGK